ncbi:TPA: hypothetical protein RQJ98_002426 [Vibrio vulnificus]|nr:hypothetical protein [Vibrio vulnificus]HDY7543844.1 hypothetical protein [Vibrio vulnificus]HDY7683878.1 hypothetical protein [Vibrio vulnificus]
MVKCALIALSLMVFSIPLTAASQCNPHGWKTLQDNQIELEGYYNTRATQYNTLLAIHKQRRLLSQQFSLDELVQLWNHADRVHYREFEQQTRSARQYANAVSSLKDQLIEKKTQALNIGSQWSSMANACKQAKRTANFNSALWYSASSNDLANDFSHLEQKFTQLGKIYEKEAHQLETAQLYAEQAK